MQNKTVVTDAFKGEDLNGITSRCSTQYESAGSATTSSRAGHGDGSVYRPDGRKMNVLDRIFPEGILIPDDFHVGTNIVHLPHRRSVTSTTTTTGAMKNAFGGLLATNRHYTHSWIHRTLVDLLAIQKEIHAGLFAVMDGTTAGNGPGPTDDDPDCEELHARIPGSGGDRCRGRKMMGFDPMGLEILSVAHEDGLGVADPRDIEVVGSDISNESWGFRVGDNGASMVGDLLWFGPLKRFQKLSFTPPWSTRSSSGARIFHDY